MRILSAVAGALLAAGAMACSDSTAPAAAPRAAVIAIVDGDGQESMTPNGAQTIGRSGFVPDSLRVRVTDAAGAPVAGAEVVWTTTAGHLETAASTTDSTGLASALWRWAAPDARQLSDYVPPGTYTASAQLPGVDFVTFTGHARVGLLLRTIEILPDTVDVAAGPVEVTVRVTVTDDREVGGVEYGQFLFWNPPDTDRAYLGKAFTLVSGTPKDGVYEGTVVVPEGVATGEWPITVTLGWGCGPSRRYDWSSHWFEGLGLPKSLHVTGGATAGASASRHAAPAAAAPGTPSLQVASCS